MRKKYETTEINEIIKSYKIDFIPVYKIAEKLKVDSSVIKRILKENNIEVISGSAFSEKYWIKRGLSEIEAKNKIVQMKPCFKEYWLNKGFNLEESKIKVELHLMNTERAYIIKFGEKGKELYQQEKDRTRRIKSKRTSDYWVGKGFNLEDAKKKVSEHQTNFSKEILINKYGEYEAEKILKIRNEKWQNSLKKKENYKDIQKTKDSNSLNFFIKKYGENYIYQKLKKINNLDEEQIIKLTEVLKEKNYELFLDYVVNNFTYNSKKINFFSSNVLFISIFEKEPKIIKYDLLKIWSINKKEFMGFRTSYDGYIFKSKNELELYRFLKEKEINFKYEYPYPLEKKQNYTCDFYLIDKDIYLEYTGILNIVENSLIKSKILNKYKIRQKLKKDILIEKNKNFFFSSSIKDIKNFINEIYEKNNKNN